MLSPSLALLFSFGPPILRRFFGENIFPSFRRLSISLHLPQAEVPLFNRSLVIDNFFQSASYNLKGNHLFYLYAPWDAESLRHMDDVELFMGSYFGHVNLIFCRIWL